MNTFTLSPNQSYSIKSATSHFDQSVNYLIDLIVSADMKTKYLRERYEGNLRYWEEIRKEIKALEEENKELEEIQEILNRMDGEIDEGEWENAGQKENQMKQNQQEQEVESFDTHKNSDNIAVLLPDLSNIHQYFLQLSNPELLLKYSETLSQSRAQKLKHEQQLDKLHQKLQNVDNQVNQTIATLKNQRKYY